MRVALLSGNAPRHNAVGNQIAEKVRFFHERGAEVRVFVQDLRQLHPDLRGCCVEDSRPSAAGPVWEYLRRADLVFAVYAECHDLLQYLPRLAGTGPRIVFDYLGVTPPNLWHAPQRESLEKSFRQRGYVWCADHCLAASEASRQELLQATHFPPEHASTLPLVVDTARFHAEPRERFLQQKLGISGPILLYVGRLAGNKRVPLLIEALARIGDETTHAVIVGDLQDVYAAEAARCRALAHELGVAARVHLLGQLDDAELPRAYRSADVLVMPSLHEGLCVPVFEAMASGLPVIASRSAALPETLGDAGLTFTPNDVEDLVHQLQRVLGDKRRPQRADGPRRIAIVSFRFGPDIVGGAETSLRTIAKALQAARHDIEVFTTCTSSESRWTNDIPPGTVTLDGLTVHRFPIDPHDHVAHGESVRTILEADGHVLPDMEQRYREQSIHSSALLAALRQKPFDAIIAGPYLFGLTADVATEFPDITLLVPCFHKEAIARLAIWPRLYGNVEGILFHSVEEKDFAQRILGVNHPNTSEIGTLLTIGAQASPAKFDRPYIVFCGRYSEQKNLPLLVEWMQRYQAERPGKLDFVCVGRGEVKLPAAPWLHELGFLDEAAKRSVLAGARALIQPSTQESLSLVALEAWAEGTPVIAHCDCAVLAGQIEHSSGGATVADYQAFAAVLDDLQQNGAKWHERGANGRAYVESHHASAKDFANRLTDAMDQMRQPIRQQMRERGLQRAQQFGRQRWQQRFTEFLELVLTQSGRPIREELRIEPLRAHCQAVAGTGTLLLPVRLVNAGTTAAIRDGAGRTEVCIEIREENSDHAVGPRTVVRLPDLLMPGQTQVAALPIALPTGIGSHRIFLWLERQGAAEPTLPNHVEISLAIEAKQISKPASCVASFLDSVQETLPRTHHLQDLPQDYIDVSDGPFASAKRLVKRKLLNNFKHAYVDVLSRQQSQVNGQVVLMIQQLAECCAMLDHAVAGVHQRLDGLEARMERCELQFGKENASNSQCAVFAGREHG